MTRSIASPVVAALLATVAGVTACGAAPSADHSLAQVESSVAVQRSAAATVPAAVRQPLGGVVIALDPGHQLGNASHRRHINHLVPAGGFQKPCNTTGTATNGGYPEATFAFRVATRLRHRLQSLGATVRMTRDRNSNALWGPCVDERGRFGNRRPVDLKISVHGDGSTSRGRGFHVIAPTDRRSWTHDIFRSSRRLALAERSALRRAGFDRATYTAGGDGLDFRSDLGTLNLSDVPTVVVELGNMRNRRDARVMISRQGQHRYAFALAAGARRFLAR